MWQCSVCTISGRRKCFQASFLLHGLILKVVSIRWTVLSDSSFSLINLGICKVLCSTQKYKTAVIETRCRNGIAKNESQIRSATCNGTPIESKIRQKINFEQIILIFKSSTKNFVAFTKFFLYLKILEISRPRSWQKYYFCFSFSVNDFCTNPFAVS